MTQLRIACTSRKNFGDDFYRQMTNQQRQSTEGSQQNQTSICFSSVLWKQNFTTEQLQQNNVQPYKTMSTRNRQLWSIAVSSESPHTHRADLAQYCTSMHRSTSYIHTRLAMLRSRKRNEYISLEATTDVSNESNAEMGIIRSSGCDLGPWLLTPKSLPGLP